MATPTLPLRWFTAAALLACGPLHAFAGAAPAPAEPAPVPAAVAVPRPSAADAAQLDQAMKDAAVKANPAIAEVLAKYPGLTLVQAPRNTAIIPALNAGFMGRHNEFVPIAQAGNIDVLFMGDSITDWWRSARGGGPNPALSGKAVFDQYFGAWKVANFGIAGDTTQGVLWRLQNGEGQGFQPKVVMLMIGTNNTGGNTAAEIAEGIGAIVLEMRKDFPQAKILLLAVFPRSAPNNPVRQTIADINARIAKLDDGQNVFFMDIGPKFLDASGAIPTDVMSDGLHPTQKGYEIWAQAVKAPLESLMTTGKLPAAQN